MSILDKIKDVFKRESPEQKLRKAIEKGDVEKVAALLKAGVNPFVFFEDSEGITTPYALAKFYYEQSPLDRNRRKILKRIDFRRERITCRLGDDKFRKYLDTENIIERAGRPLTKKEISRRRNAIAKEVIREATLGAKNNVQEQALRKKLAKQLWEVRKKHGHKARSVAREDAKINETRNLLDRHLLNRIAGER